MFWFFGEQCFEPKKKEKKKIRPKKYGKREEVKQVC